MSTRTYTRTPWLHFGISLHVEGKQKFSGFDSTGIQPAERFWRFVAAFHFLIKHPKTDAHMCAYTHTFTLPHKLADAHAVWGGGEALLDMILIRLERLKQLTY